MAAEAHAAQNAPDMHVAELNAELALDERADSFERPQLCAKAVGLRPLAQRCVEPFEGSRIKLAGAAHFTHGA